MDLYQFPISHFCEKARWALDYKGVEWRPTTLLPGLHVRTATRLGGKSTVPILVDRGRAIQGSGAIIDYLDARVPARSLTPADPDAQREAREWEQYLDAEVGVHVRRWLYSVFLDYPDRLIPLFTQGGPWYGPILYRLIFPQVRRRIRALLHINERTARESRDRVLAAARRLAEHLAGRSFIAGGEFSRADLTAAALFAPLWMPPGYGVKWPALPPDLEPGVAAAREPTAFVPRLYERFR